MRKSKRLLSVILMAVMCFILIGNLFAADTTLASGSMEAGGYGTLTCSLQQRGYMITTTARITQNPDSAYLKIKVELQRSGTALANYEATSADGVKQLNDNTFVEDVTSGVPTRAYSASSVQGGSTEKAYTVYLTLSLDTTYFE